MCFRKTVKNGSACSYHLRQSCANQAEGVMVPEKSELAQETGLGSTYRVEASGNDSCVQRCEELLQEMRLALYSP